MWQPFLFESQLSKCVILGPQCLYIALHFRGNGDLLPAMPFSRFASFPAWGIFLSRSLYIASLFRGISDLLPVMPFSRFASFAAWVISVPRI